MQSELDEDEISGNLTFQALTGFVYIVVCCASCSHSDWVTSSPSHLSYYVLFVSLPLTLPAFLLCVTLDVFTDSFTDILTTLTQLKLTLELLAVTLLSTAFIFYNSKDIICNIFALNVQKQPDFAIKLELYT